MDEFLGRGVVFWTAIQAIAVCASAAVVGITLWFLYKQVRTATKTFEIDAIRRLQELVDDFREDRRLLFTTFPLNIVLHQDQFPQRPPGRHKPPRLTEGEIRRMELTEEQKRALNSLSSEQRELAQRVIARLNDIGELIEDGIINRRVFLGKYHVMVIQCCHILEAIRRDEERRRGGNYGQRLLRMRHWATTYNDASPKHREIPIKITNGQDRRLVYQTPSPTFSRRIRWAVYRFFARDCINV